MTRRGRPYAQAELDRALAALPDRPFRFRCFYNAAVAIGATYAQAPGIASALIRKKRVRTVQRPPGRRWRLYEKTPLVEWRAIADNRTNGLD